MRESFFVVKQMGRKCFFGANKFRKKTHEFSEPPNFETLSLPLCMYIIHIYILYVNKSDLHYVTLTHGWLVLYVQVGKTVETP